MKIIYIVFFVLLWFITPAQTKHKVVFVIADGIPADVIERLKPPAMQQVISEGVYKRAFVGGIKGTYSEMPTISAPGYNNLLTGTWAYKHNVWDNDNQHPNYNYPSLFRLVKTADPRARTAIFSTWIENRKMLLGAGLPQTGHLAIDEVYDGYENDTARFPHDTAGAYLNHIDDHVVHCADSVIKKNGPDLSWIYLEYTDEIGHIKGTGAAFDSAIALLDKQVKIINGAIKFRETYFNEKWLLIITTDHGRDSITGNGHGDQSTRERTTWIIMNQQATNDYFAANTPAIVDIAPSIARYLNISPPAAVKREWDGTPFIGPVSLSNVHINTSGDSLNVTWTSYRQDAPVNILISFTNFVKEGKTDNYQLLGTQKAGKNEFSCKIKDLLKHCFFKVVVEGKYNTCNAWYIAKDNSLK